MIPLQKSRNLLKSDDWKISDCGVRYLMCVAAASVAEATTYPLDLCKTRWNHPSVKSPSRSSWLFLIINRPHSSQAPDSGGVVLWQRKRKSLQRDDPHHVWNCQRGGFSHSQNKNRKIYELFFLSSGVVPVVERHAAGSLQTCNIYR